MPEDSQEIDNYLKEIESFHSDNQMPGQMLSDRQEDTQMSDNPEAHTESQPAALGQIETALGQSQNVALPMMESEPALGNMDEVTEGSIGIFTTPTAAWASKLELVNWVADGKPIQEALDAHVSYCTSKGPHFWRVNADSGQVEYLYFPEAPLGGEMWKHFFQ